LRRPQWPGHRVPPGARWWGRGHTGANFAIKCSAYSRSQAGRMVGQGIWTAQQPSPRRRRPGRCLTRISERRRSSLPC
jgi:hypothetical protein